MVKNACQCLLMLPTLTSFVRSFMRALFYRSLMNLLDLADGRGKV
jgi:hypothetical protein